MAMYKLVQEGRTHLWKWLLVNNWSLARKYYMDIPYY